MSLTPFQVRDTLYPSVLSYYDITTADDYVFLSDYGIDATGQTDSQALLQSVIDQNPGKRIIFPDGTVKINSRVVITSNNTVLDLRNCYIDASEFTGWEGTPTDFDSPRFRAVFEFRGTFKGFFFLAEDIVKDTYTIVLDDASQVAVGDILYLVSFDDLWYGNTYKFDANMVLSISGNTLTLAFPNILDITGSIRAMIMTPIQNVQLLGGHAWGGGRRPGVEENGVGPTFVTCEAFVNAIIKPNIVEGFQSGATYFITGLYPVFDGYRIIGMGLNDPPAVEGPNSGFAGVLFYQGRYGYFRVNAVERVRHAQDSNRFHYCYITCTSSTINSHRPPFGSHEGANEFMFDNITYTGKYSPIQWRGANATVSNCNFHVTDGSYGFYDTFYAVDNTNRKYLFSHNNIVCSRDAISLRSISNQAIISGPSHLESTDSAYYPITINGGFQKVIVSGGVHIKTAGARCIYISGTLENTIIVNGASFEGYTQNPLRLAMTNQPNCKVVVGNNIGFESYASIYYYTNNGVPITIYSHIGATRTVDGLSNTYTKTTTTGQGSWRETRSYTGEYTAFAKLSIAWGNQDGATGYSLPIQISYPRTLTEVPIVSAHIESATPGDVQIRSQTTTSVSLSSSLFNTTHSVHIILKSFLDPNIIDQS